MPVEEPRRKRKRGVEEPDRYPEPKRETKPQIVPPSPPKPPKKAPPGTKWTASSQIRTMTYGPSQSNSSKLLIYGRRNFNSLNKPNIRRITATEQNAVTIFAALLIADAIRAAGRLD